MYAERITVSQWQLARNSDPTQLENVLKIIETLLSNVTCHALRCSKRELLTRKDPFNLNQTPLFRLVSLDCRPFFELASFANLLDETGFKLDDLRDSDNNTLLTFSAKLKNTAILGSLLRRGASPLMPNFLGEFALGLIAERAYPPSFVVDESGSNFDDDENMAILHNKMKSQKIYTVRFSRIFNSSSGSLQ